MYQINVSLCERPNSFTLDWLRFLSLGPTEFTEKKKIYPIHLILVSVRESKGRSYSHTSKIYSLKRSSLNQKDGSRLMFAEQGFGNSMKFFRESVSKQN